jgi:serine/threonine-protein kinase
MFPQIFGKYVLEREIAAGGMARVFLATLRGAVGFEKRLVVKQIRAELAVDEAFVRRFVEEAKTAVELSHPNIVPVYELGVEQGVYYIAMEYCSGVTLSEVLARTGPLDPEEGAYVGAEVCRALEYAHRRAGIVHRDVTPRNVLLDDEGSVRLIDFGIAAPAEASGGRREVFGSPGHMPPEQLRGDALGPQTDVFAVGALLIEAWTGKPPFRRATAHESALALREAPPPVAGTSPALAPISELIGASVAFEAQARPSDAEQLGRGLRDFLRSADSVEVGRRLAARVRQSHPVDQAAPATSVRPPFRTSEQLATEQSAPPALETPPHATPTTATFAAREEIVEWTRKLSSIPPPLGMPDGTRRLSTAPSLGREPLPRNRRALWIGGVVAFAGASALASGLFRERPASGTLPEIGPKSSPVAVTTALEARTPALGSSGQKPAVEGASVLAVVAPATPPEAAPTRPSNAVSSAAAAPASALPRTATSSAQPRSLASREPATSGTPRAPANVPPTASSGSATPSSPSERVADGTLRLTSDPQAVVSVTGNGFSQTSTTPVRSLAVTPGRYRIVFRSETYGAPVATEVTLAPGASRSVHADFRAAEPSVIVR